MGKKIAVKVDINVKPGDFVKFTGNVKDYESLYGFCGLTNDIWGIVHMVYVHDLTAEVFFGGDVYNNTIDAGGMYPGLLTMQLSDLELDDEDED